MTKITVSGGDKLATKLKEIESALGLASGVRAGFLEGATYPDGESVAYIASIQEYGAVINVREHQQTIYRKLDKNGDFAKSGKFVRRAQSNFATSHTVGAHLINIPSRPFFRTMIAKKSPGWGVMIGKLSKRSNYDMETVWGLMGQEIKGDLQESIRNWVEPPNAASTIRKKGFNKPLTDTGHMQNSVDYQVLK